MKSVVRLIRGNTITGIIILIPLIVTVYIIIKLFVLVDSALPHLVHSIVRSVPDHWFTGAGLAISLIIAFIFGIAARNYIGKRLIRTGNRLIARIPFISKVYIGVQQILDAVVSQDKKLFEKVVLVEFPRPGYYSIGLMSSHTTPEITDRVGQRTVTVLVPLSPSPTHGILLFTRESELIELDMTVETAFKLIVSAGIFKSDQVAKDHYGVHGPLSGWNWVKDLKRWDKNIIHDPRD
jgi:uncharacterized membrane protein